MRHNKIIIWESLKILLVIYLALLALLAPLGLHRALLVFPAKGIYSLFALLLLVVSFGRLSIETPLRGAWRRGKQRRRSLQIAVRDWRREQEEERVVWSSASEEIPSLFHDKKED